MYRRVFMLFLSLLVLSTQTGCWSSKEIEDLALYTGLALDSGQPAPTEEAFEAKGGTYSKQNKVMATVQVVPIKSVGTRDKSSNEKQTPYQNVSGSGDSILEIFRQFSIRLDRPIIGHHLKVIIISSELLQKQKIEQVVDFLLRDNDIRPSTMVYVSEGPARDTLVSSQPNEVPSFHIMGMKSNQSRTSKVLKPVTLAKLDALMYAKKSFVLQNLITGGGEVEFSGAGIIKGETGHWIGNLTQEDTECLSWLKNEGRSGAIKAYDRDKEPLTYEIKSMKSKISAIAGDNKIAFNVKISTEGRFIETWNTTDTASPDSRVDVAEQAIEQKLRQMMQTLITKLQSEYKADVAGFGDTLSMEHPAVWKKVRDNWEEVFSQAEINITYDVKITDLGSFTE